MGGVGGGSLGHGRVVLAVFSGTTVWVLPVTEWCSDSWPGIEREGLKENWGGEFAGVRVLIEPRAIILTSTYAV